MTLIKNLQYQNHKFTSITQLHGILLACTLFWSWYDLELMQMTNKYVVNTNNVNINT